MHGIRKKLSPLGWNIIYILQTKRLMGIAWDKDLKCDNCGSLIESVYHVLWICPIARAVWKRMLRMLYPIYGRQVYTWGFVRWGRLAKEIQNYEKEYGEFLLLSDGRHV